MNSLYRFSWFMTRVIGRTGRVKIYGVENVPKTGPFIIASNHISYLDPPFTGCWHEREQFYLAKKNLFNLPIVGWILGIVHAIPLNRGAIDRQAIALCIEALNNNFGLVVFPEGTRSMTDDFLKPKPGVGLLAIQAGCPIIPVYLRGTNRMLDCILGKSQLSISYGEPLSVEWISGFKAEKESYIEISKTVMERIAQLKQKVLSLK